MADNKRYARTITRINPRGHEMAGPHEWHPFDVEAGLDARQLTAEGEPDRYQVRDRDGKITDLDAAGFAQLRDVGPNPKGL